MKDLLILLLCGLMVSHCSLKECSATVDGLAGYDVGYLYLPGKALPNPGPTPLTGTQLAGIRKILSSGGFFHKTPGKTGRKCRFESDLKIELREKRQAGLISVLVCRDCQLLRITCPDRYIEAEYDDVAEQMEAWIATLSPAKARSARTPPPGPVADSALLALMGDTLFHSFLSQPSEAGRYCMTGVIGNALTECRDSSMLALMPAQLTALSRMLNHPGLYERAGPVPLCHEPFNTIIKLSHAGTEDCTLYLSRACGQITFCNTYEHRGLNCPSLINEIEKLLKSSIYEK